MVFKPTSAPAIEGFVPCVERTLNGRLVERQVGTRAFATPDAAALYAFEAARGAILGLIDAFGDDWQFAVVCPAAAAPASVVATALRRTP